MSGQTLGNLKYISGHVGPKIKDSQEFGIVSVYFGHSSYVEYLFTLQLSIVTCIECPLRVVMPVCGRLIGSVMVESSSVIES